MGMGNSPADKYFNELRAKADADRAARLAGHKSLFRRLLERLRPHEQQPVSDSGPRPSDVARFRPSRSVRSCQIGLLAGTVGGCLIQLHPGLSRSGGSKSGSSDHLYGRARPATAGSPLTSAIYDVLPRASPFVA